MLLQTAVEIEYTNTSLHSKVLRISTDRTDLLDFDNTDGLVTLEGRSTIQINVTLRPLACKRHVSYLLWLVSLTAADMLLWLTAPSFGCSCIYQ